MPKSVIYTLAVVRSAQSMFYTDRVLIGTNDTCSVGVRDDVLSLPKLGNYYVFELDYESPWLWGNSYRAFSLPKQ